MPPTIRSHPLSHPSSTTTISQTLEVLKPHLPIPLPLYRRLQAGHFSPTASILTNLSTLETSPREEQHPYLLAFLDRTRRPETELWLFCFWETNPDTEPTTAQQKIQNDLLLALFKTIQTLDLPPSIHTFPTATHPPNPTILVCGAIHTTTLPSLARNNLLSPHFPTPIPYTTYLFNTTALPPPGQLPPTLHYGTLTTKDFPRVLASTQIARQERTLAVLPNQAIYETATGEPVAWAFVGLDASLTSLHVEDGWRGQGLAKAVTGKLFREGMGIFWEAGVQRWAYAHVEAGNEASRRVCRSLRGRAEWEIVWARVDLGRVGR